MRKKSILYVKTLLVLCAFSFALNLTTKAQTTLKHSYTFEDGSANDGTGEAHGTIIGGEIADGKYTADTDGEYIELPGATISINSYTALTLEAFILDTESAPTNSMLFYLGGSPGGLGANGTFVAPNHWNGPATRGAISTGNTTAPWDAETAVTTSPLTTAGLHHVVLTINSDSLSLFIDGVFIDSELLSAQGNSISALSNDYAWIARGGYASDDTWLGSLEEFNIYEGAMDATTVSSRAESFLSVSNSKLTELSADAGTLVHAFDADITTYELQVPSSTTSLELTANAYNVAATVTGGGTIAISELPQIETISVTSQDGSSTTEYTVAIVEESCFSQFFPLKTNLVDDPEMINLGNFGGWEWVTGARNQNSDPTFAYCGAYSGSVSAAAEGTASFDYVLNTKLEAGKTYRVRAQVYATSGTFNFGAYNVDASTYEVYTTTNGEWEWMDLVFTTGSGINTASCGLYFNNYNQDGNGGYIDNWECYEVSTDATLASLTSQNGSVSYDALENIYYLLYDVGTTDDVLAANATVSGSSVEGDGAIALEESGGTLTIDVTAEDGQTTNSYTVYYTFNWKATELDKEEASAVSIYPTVTSGTFNVDITGQAASISVYDVSGKLVYNKNTTNSIEQVTLKKSGIYFIKVNCDGQSTISRIIKLD